MTRIVLIGPPGAGKGTQAGVLARELGIPIVSTGELFRQHIERGTTLGRQLRESVSRGALVPDAIVTRVVTERLGEPETRTGFILDGFPRTTSQVGELDKALLAAGQVLTRVFLLDAAESVLIARLGRRAVEQGRPDDVPDVIKTRLRVYLDSIAPVLDNYDQRDLLTRIDADRAPEDVSNDLLAVVGGESSPMLLS